MLLSLKISNFALIKESNLEFDKGLNVLSGETGAGKSIIFEALAVCLGERASKSMIRQGTDHSIIEAVFDISEELRHVLVTKGIVLDEAEEVVVIRRDLYLEYPNVSRINGFSVGLSDLKYISSFICDIYGQYEHQLLLNKDNYIKILDKFARQTDIKKYDNLIEKTEQYYKLISDKVKAYEKLKLKESELDKEIDYIKFQINEIVQINPVSGELEEIQSELRHLQNLELINSSINDAVAEMDSSEFNYDSKGAISSVNNAISSLNKITDLVNWIPPIVDRLKSVNIELDDILHTLNEEVCGEEDLDRIEELSLRQSKLQMLEKKYNTDIEGVLKERDSLERELEDLKNIDDTIKNFERDINELKNSYKKFALELSNFRKEVAIDLKIKLVAELKELEMQNTEFDIVFTEKSFSKDGIDDIEFYAKTNKGAAFNPVREIISGGEMSRFMLALKNVMSDSNKYKTFVFDEIDAGLSGKVANSVGKRLENFSNDRQVLIISHLPQIVSKADTNFKIEKHDEEDQTVSTVRKLNKQENIREVARLLSGDNITEENLKSAELLIGEKRS
ncbi:MAG: DNA repair protein RecN [Ezakiella sp.]|nr:DNA repair protein RecN [Bacillota bacterium]MDY3923842.1 DNA repair protein RecN [Ezakiella sp.]